MKPKAPAPIVSRVTGAKNIISSPKIIISSVEAEKGLRYSWETLDFFFIITLKQNLFG